MTTIFSLTPNPTFKVNVEIPRAGAEDGILTFTFKHKRNSEIIDIERKFRDETNEMFDSNTVTNEPMADFIMSIADGWALGDEFNRDNIIELLENYPRAFSAISVAFTKELMANREKN